MVGGHNIEDVQKRVYIKDIFYAGNHGFDISGPHALKREMPEAKKLIPMLNKAEKELQKAIQEFYGAGLRERNFQLLSITAMLKNRNEEKQTLKRGSQNLCRNYSGLRLNPGKEVLDLGLDLDWNKGKAVLWLLEHIPSKNSIFPIYIGDDLTDEDAFNVLGKNGLGIVVREHPRNTNADYALNDTKEVQMFLKELVMEKSE